jgi:hypothetical protein
LRSGPKVPNLQSKFVNIRLGSFASEHGQLPPVFETFGSEGKAFEIRKGL